MAEVIKYICDRCGTAEGVVPKAKIVKDERGATFQADLCEGCVKDYDDFEKRIAKYWDVFYETWGSYGREVG